MINSQNHIIRTFEVEATFLQKKHDMQIHNQVAEVVREKLLPALETLFDQKAPAGRHIKIDTLEIEAEITSAANWQEQFVEATINKIRQKLDAINTFAAPGEVYEISYQKGTPVEIKQAVLNDQIQSLLHFIQDGYFPWNITSSNVEIWFNDLAQNCKSGGLKDEVRQKIIETILSSKTTFLRFINQLPKNLSVALIQSALYADTTTGRMLISRGLSTRDSIIVSYLNLFAESTHPIYKNHIEEILRQTLSPETLIHLQQELSLQQGQLQKLIKEINDKPRENLPLKKFEKESYKTEAIFVENAGLAILHPFLPQLFRHLQFTDGRTFVNSEQQARAVLFTQYLVTGQKEIPEYDLLLNKVLCGLAIEATLDNEIVLTEAGEIEAVDVLESVIRHWSALKNTSIEGLRNTFLQRPGKLAWHNDHWLLQVEQKTVDVLLNYLPWGLGIIKLPWMESRLVVEWTA